MWPAAQQTTAPITNAAAGPAGCPDPMKSTSSRAATIVVATVTPETGLLELPTISAIYAATDEKRKAASAITIVIRRPRRELPTTVE